MSVCRTPGAQFHIGIGPRIVVCKVDIPFDLGLTKAQAVALENGVHNALEGVLYEYWPESEEGLPTGATEESFEDLLERRLREKNEGSL